MIPAAAAIHVRLLGAWRKCRRLATLHPALEWSWSNPAPAFEGIRKKWNSRN